MIPTLIVLGALAIGFVGGIVVRSIYKGGK